MTRALSEDTIERVAVMARRGATMAAIGEAIGVSRNAASGMIHRFRKAGDARFGVAGSSPIQTRAERMDLLADAFADGAPTLEAAAAIAGITLSNARSLWADVRAKLGRQAR